MSLTLKRLYNPVLLSRFEDAIEWRLSGAAEFFEAARQHGFSNRLFSSDRTERWAIQGH